MFVFEWLGGGHTNAQIAGCPAHPILHTLRAGKAKVLERYHALVWELKRFTGGGLA
jgi:hypothetical protein